MKRLLFLLLLAATLATVALAQETPGSSARMVVTVEAKRSGSVPVINQEDVMVFEGRDRDKVTGWVPLQGENAGLELFVLIDDAAASSLGSQLDDLRKFIAVQPASTKLGIAYMQNGTAQVLLNLSADHAQAAKALRLPLSNAGVSASPYFSLSDLIKRWPQSSARREILMISDGIDRYWDGGPGNPNVDNAIEDAQRAGVIVFAIYTPGEGHFGHNYWRINWGQNYLSQVADETGGESYAVTFMGAPVSFRPYLDDLTQRLGRQYLLTFLAKPQKKSGMQRVKVMTEVPNAEMVSADRVFVPASE